jgi:fatty acid desaturase
MREQVHVIKQRAGRGFSVVKYALAALRYLLTGFVALLLALVLILLLVEAGAAIGAALEHVHEDVPASGNCGGAVTGASPQTRAAFLEGGS